MMNFSVLLSLYVKEQPTYLKLSLDSIFSQTLLPTEIILVKDGLLTKELDEVVEEFCSKSSIIKVVSLSKNQGLGKALNEGLKHCSYDLVARMDTDDIAKPDRFEKQLKVFQDNPNIDIVSSWIDEFESDVCNILSTRKLPETHEGICRYAQKRNPVNHPVVMFKKSAVIAAGGYQHFPLFEDYFLWVRMLLNGSKFYNIQESLLYFRASTDMFKRRGGFKYACTEARFQWRIHRLGFISLPRTCLNVLVRFGTRIIPNHLRSWIYKKMLR